MQSSEVFATVVTIYPELMAGITLILGLILHMCSRSLSAADCGC